VSEGDTLSGIALWWFGSGDEHLFHRIRLANRRVIGEDPNLIFSGQWLTLPFYGFWYSIERGDTLNKLAELVYGEENVGWIIRQANPSITDPDMVRVSEWIWVP